MLQYNMFYNITFERPPPLTPAQRPNHNVIVSFQDFRSIPGFLR